VSLAIMADAPHVFFVPGAWLGGWSWIPVATRVAAAGYGVTTLTLPGLAPGDHRTGLTLEDAIRHVADAVSKVEGPVVLVAHSGGGTPAAAAAVRLKERVVKVVFVDAYVPLDGVSVDDEMLGVNRDSSRQSADASPDGSVTLPLEAFQFVMLPGASPQAQQVLFELFVPEPSRYLRDPARDVDLVAAGVPAAYVLAEEDTVGGLPLPGATFARRAGVEPVMVPGGHLALMTHPDEVAAAILAAL